MDHYRAWDTKSERMIYSYEPTEQGKREFYPLAFDIGFSHWSQDDLVIMRGIGIKDVTGKEIFIQDNVVHGYLDSRIGTINARSPIAMYIVEDDPFLLAHVAWQATKEPSRGLLIIGNIFEGRYKWLNQNTMGTDSLSQKD